MNRERITNFKALLEIILKERKWYSEEYPKSAGIKTRIFKNDGVKFAFLILTAIVMLVPFYITSSKTGRSSYFLQGRTVILTGAIFIAILLITRPIWDKIIMRAAVSDVTLYENMFSYRKRDVSIIEYAPYSGIKNIDFITREYRFIAIQHLVNISINGKSYELLYGTDINEEMLVKFIYECALHDVNLNEKKFLQFLRSARRSLFSHL